MISTGMQLAERGMLPDPLVRWGIRRLCLARLRSTSQQRSDEREAWIEVCRTGPIAKSTQRANEQHYEVPADFFSIVLGERNKYSSAYWKDSTTGLEEAEVNMLALTCDRAELADGMQVLDLGCGWGALTLWIAEHYPECHVTAVSNSSSQRAFIERKASDLGAADRVRVITADVNDFSLSDPVDRVLSVEMFEHVHNMSALLQNIRGWLKPEGKLFVHHFCHRQDAYPFDLDDDHNWMAQHFFTGGMMPHHGWLDHFSDDLQIRQQWWIEGTHYQRTCNAWLDRMSQHRAEIWPVLEATYGSKNAGIWYHRWRMFFMACAELFGLRDGSEWGVGHYLLSSED